MSWSHFQSRQENLPSRAPISSAWRALHKRGGEGREVWHGEREMTLALIVRKCELQSVCMCSVAQTDDSTHLAMRWGVRTLTYVCMYVRMYAQDNTILIYTYLCIKCPVNYS